jgi:acetate kinase
VNVLVLNCGSSSLKFQLIDTDLERAAAGTDRVLAKGIVDDIGGAGILKLEAAGRPAVKESAEVLEHKIAVEKVVDWLCQPGGAALGSRDDIHAVGHRVVHGGERFKASVRIDEAVLQGIEACFEMAPLHNPPNVKGYRAVRELLGDGVPQVAVFDTSFHQTMAPAAYIYGLPYLLYERHGIRRYGFHGTSHRYVSRRLSALLQRRPDEEGLRLITCHLGNGCSVAAIRGGKSVDTSMGFTPLEGLVMGSRSGDLDPAILPHLMRKEELGPWEMSALLNKHSGLFGISGVSNDMRTLLEAEQEGHARARLAVDVFCHRLKKYIAAYVGVLGGIDGLAFAGGIGENAPAIRRRALDGLDALGLALDHRVDDGVRGQEAEISPHGSRVRAFVIPTNEEILIARDTLHLVSGRPPS